MASQIPPTVAELRAAFNRASELKFTGWTFEAALSSPLVAWSLKQSALAVRRSQNLPAQPRLF